MNSHQFWAGLKRQPLLRFGLYPVLEARRRYLNRGDAFAEKILVNLRELVVGDLLVKVDEFEGIFTLDCRSDLFKRIVVQKQYEPDLVQRCLKLLDCRRSVVDVGANVGFYSVLFAKQLEGGKVLCVEPTQRALVRLKKNIEMNGVAASTIVFEGVASNKGGMVEIKTVEGKEEYSSIGEMKHPAVSNAKTTTESVVASTVDELVQLHSLDVGFIKVDVEGVEHLVFKGAAQVLSKHRPVILSELSDRLLRQNGSSFGDVLKLIKGFGYNVYDAHHLDSEAVPVEFGEIICIPK